MRRKMEKGCLSLIIALCIILSTSVLCHAETAQVLPKGVFSFDATYYYYLNIHKRYNPDGDSEDIAIDYNGDLNSNVFPDLAALNPFVGGNASIGSSVVKFTWFYRWFEFSSNYGITDKLSVGVLVPFNHTKNEVHAHLDNSTANVGKNPYYKMGILPPPLDSAPLIPISAGGVKLDTEDVQDLLGRGLDVNNDGIRDISGFGYKRFETWSGDTIGDIEVGAKYQILNKGTLRFALGGGVRLPTGYVDDPDNLTDLSSGDGQTDILLRFYADYIGIKRLLLNATVYYDIQLPDRQELRVPDNVNRPITANKEDVHRNLGDVVELSVTGCYSFTPEISGGVTYRYSTKARDHVSGDKGFAYSSLEDETAATSHMILVTLGYSFVQKYLDKKFPMPIYANVTYRYRFAGTNNVTKSQYVSLNLGVYF
jgi:hypothetical protein